MSDNLDKVIVVTGASSGIGQVTAELLAKNGAKLVVVARRIERLNDLVKDIKNIGGEAIAIEADVTSLESMQNVVNQTVEKYGSLDVWVNNAGVMPLAPIEMNRYDEWNWMVDVNIKGVLNGIAAAQQVMREKGSGHFVNISSVAGHIVFPGAAVYCATKFAVKALSEGIRMESDGSIRVTNISPGAVSTELTDHIGVPEVKEGVKQFTDIAIDASAIARGIKFAVEQPLDVDVNEIIIRPTKQAL